MKARLDLDRLLLIAAAAAPAGALVLTPFVEGWPARRYLLLYLAPIVSAFALWLRLRLREGACWTPRHRLIDALVILFAGARVLGPFLPASGHMLFFVHSGATTRGWGYRLLAMSLALETTVFKLLIWSDARSWLIGGAAGLCSAVAYRAAGSGREVYLP